MPACPTPAVAGCRKVFPDLESWQGSDLGVVGAPKRSWTWRDVGGVQEPEKTGMRRSVRHISDVQPGVAADPELR